MKPAWSFNFLCISRSLLGLTAHRTQLAVSLAAFTPSIVAYPENASVSVPSKTAQKTTSGD
jgi:hypothetical protein